MKQTIQEYCKKNKCWAAKYDFDNIWSTYLIEPFYNLHIEKWDVKNYEDIVDTYLCNFKLSIIRTKKLLVLPNGEFAYKYKNESPYEIINVCRKNKIWGAKDKNNVWSLFLSRPNFSENAKWVAENKEDFIDTFNVIGEDVPIAFEKSLISPEGKFVFSTEKISQDLMKLRFIKPNLFKGELI